MKWEEAPTGAVAILLPALAARIPLPRHEETIAVRHSP